MNIIFPLSVVIGIMSGGRVLMYKFMHVCKNVCVPRYMYVGVQTVKACMCVRLANDFINFNTETK